MATASHINADYLIVSEPNLRATKGPRWVVDKRGDAAIGIMEGRKILELGKGEGFVWVRTSFTLIFSVYISPNSRFAGFESFIHGLTECIYETCKDGDRVVIAGVR